MTVISPSFIMILLELFGSIKYVNHSTESSGKKAFFLVVGINL